MLTVKQILQLLKIYSILIRLENFFKSLRVIFKDPFHGKLQVLIAIFEILLRFFSFSSITIFFFEYFTKILRLRKSTLILFPNRFFSTYFVPAVGQ